MSTKDEFIFRVDRLDGVRLIRGLFPSQIRTSSIPETFAGYLSLWDDEEETVALADISRLIAFTPEVRQALAVLMKRLTIHPGFIASAWVTGTNHALVPELTALLIEAGRDPQSIFFRDDQALEHLRKSIAHYRS